MKKIFKLWVIACLSGASLTNLVAQDSAPHEYIEEATIVSEAPEDIAICDDCSVYDVEYTDESTIIKFRFQDELSIGTTITIFDPKDEDAWILKDANSDRIFPMTAVRNLMREGKKISDNLDEQAHFFVKTSGEEMILTCELHFDRLPSDVTQVHLIEGIDNINNHSNFHVKDISITPQIEEQVAIDEDFDFDEIILESMPSAPVQNAVLDTKKNDTDLHNDIVTCDECSVYNIEYTNNGIVLKFKYQDIESPYTSITLWGPQEDYAWVLKDANSDRIFPMTAVRNVQENGTQTYENVSEYASFYSQVDVEKGEEYAVTCEIHFDKLPNDVTKVHLVEGIGYESYGNHFNLKDIAIEPQLEEAVAINEPVEVLEPVIEPSTNLLLIDIEPELIEEQTMVNETEVIEWLSEEEIVLDEVYPLADYDYEWISTENIIATDESPKHKGTQRNYIIDQVDYTENHTILHFRFICDNGQYTGATFFAPGQSDAWQLQDAKSDAVYHVQSIRNIQQNGEVRKDELNNTNSYWSNYADDKTVYSCEIYFDRLPEDMTLGHLVEGNVDMNRKDRFNVKNIHFMTFAEEEVIIEEVIDLLEEPAEEPAEEIVAEESNESAIANLESNVSISWKAYPNPADNWVNVELAEASEVQIMVYDANGRLLQQHNTANIITVLDISDFPSGTYMVSVVDGDQVTSKQIVKR